MRNRDVLEIGKPLDNDSLTHLKKRSEVFHIVILDNGIAHSTRRDGISFFESIETAQAFAEELIDSGETRKAYVETIDGYGIPYDPDPEIRSDSLRREAARRLRQADDETDARLMHQWRREDTFSYIKRVLNLNAPAEFKRDFILELLGTLGVYEKHQTVCRNMDVNTFLSMCVTTFLK
jgi:hypothetical protein